MDNRSFAKSLLQKHMSNPLAVQRSCVERVQQNRFSFICMICAATDYAAGHEHCQVEYDQIMLLSRALALTAHLTIDDTEETK